jgi:hypothetical protein
MKSAEPAVLVHMQRRISQWQATGDQRVIFLRCYWMMTSNMLLAVEDGQFVDGIWVKRLLQRFAVYYLAALNTYEHQPETTPLVWRSAFDTARTGKLLPVQHLLLGVNAHINYDLVLALNDVLVHEWDRLDERQRITRYQDHCHVNTVIANTIDAVQDEVLTPASPWMAVLDRLLGSVDEHLISGLITQWRENVWQNAIRLVQTRQPGAQSQLVAEVQAQALQRDRLIRLKK